MLDDADLDPVIHQRTRLQLMAYLYRNRQAAFSTLKETFDLTSGNTATHTNRLEDEGYIEGQRVVGEGSIEKRYRITAEGSDAFRRYVAALEGLLDVGGLTEPSDQGDQGDGEGTPGP